MSLCDMHTALGNTILTISLYIGQQIKIFTLLFLLSHLLFGWKNKNCKLFCKLNNKVKY